jgi:hypothetical protein
VDFKCR